MVASCYCQALSPGLNAFRLEVEQLFVNNILTIYIYIYGIYIYIILFVYYIYIHFIYTDAKVASFRMFESM